MNNHTISFWNWICFIIDSFYFQIQFIISIQINLTFFFCLFWSLTALYWQLHTLKRVAGICFINSPFFIPQKKKKVIQVGNNMRMSNILGWIRHWKIHIHQPLFGIPGMDVSVIMSRTVIALLYIPQYSGVGFSDKQKQRQTSTHANKILGSAQAQCKPLNPLICCIVNIAIKHCGKPKTGPQTHLSVKQYIYWG